MIASRKFRRESVLFAGRCPDCDLDFTVSRGWVGNTPAIHVSIDRECPHLARALESPEGREMMRTLCATHLRGKPIDMIKVKLGDRGGAS